MRIIPGGKNSMCKAVSGTSLCVQVTWRGLVRPDSQNHCCEVGELDGARLGRARSALVRSVDYLLFVMRNHWMEDANSKIWLLRNALPRARKDTGKPGRRLVSR